MILSMPSNAPPQMNSCLLYTSHLSGQGTAKAPWLEMLGLSDAHRDVLLAPCPESAVSAALAELQTAAGDSRYFAVVIPLSGIAGRDAYEQLAQGGTAHGKSV